MNTYDLSKYYTSMDGFYKWRNNKRDKSNTLDEFSCISQVWDDINLIETWWWRNDYKGFVKQLVVIYSEKSFHVAEMIPI